MVFFRPWRERQKRHRDRDAQTEHSKRHERLGDEGQIVRQDAFPKGRTAEKERQPTKKRQNERRRRPGVMPLEHLERHAQFGTESN